MATRPTSGHDGFAETCDCCGQETLHEVRVEIRDRDENAAFSREPYRVATCQSCGSETATRMNNA